jgi:Protein of unknown function (DUF4236)
LDFVSGGKRLEHPFKLSLLQARLAITNLRRFNMGWNLRRRKKILPGVNLNVSNKGIGISVGPEHAKISISPSKKITSNVGIPGTGIRYTNVSNTKKSQTKGGNVSEGTTYSGDGEDADFAKSRFNREPKNVDEWKQTLDDYRTITDLIGIVANRKSDKSVAKEFPVQKGEVVFLKITSGLTNYENANLDAGFVYVTSQRVMFMGQKRTCEWLFSNMTMPLPMDDTRICLFQNTDHEEVTGIKYIGNDWYKFQLNVLMAYSLTKNPIDETLKQMKETVEKYALVKPNE